MSTTTFSVPVYTYSFRICFLTEGIPCISLNALLENGRGVAEMDAANIIAQISLAVGYLHESHIVHRNLRPEIFSLDWRGRLKISDLSTCKVSLL